MKKIFGVLIVVMAVGLPVNLSAGGGREKKEESTLTVMTMGNVAGEAVKTIAAKYAETHPGFSIDLTSIDGVTDFNTALSAKIAANDIPDILYMQWDNLITKFGKNGYLLPLDDLGLDDKLVAIKKKINVVGGKTYAYPAIQMLWGMYWNEELAKKHGVNYIPKTMDQLLESFETMRKNGLPYPFLTAGMDLSGATALVFAYMHQQISGQDPLFYLKICEGTKSWNGSEVRQMYEYYGKMMEYAPKDIMGVDQDEFRRRFVRGEVVMSIWGSNVINTLHTLNPNFKFILAPAMAVVDEQNACVSSDFDAAFAIGANTKKAALAKDFYKFLFEPANSELIAVTLGSLSTVKAAKPQYDPAILSNIPYILSGNFVSFAERDWIPGIKDIVKKNTQDWMSGAVPLNQALNNLQAEHLRLINANPAFIDEYRDLLRESGILK
jgi:ABC-type glycerol-3-phosphate transport system substrate-binding protein